VSIKLTERVTMPSNETQPDSSLEPISSVVHLPVLLEVELDRVAIPFQELMTLRTGSVIPLVKSAGDTVDLVVGETRFAAAEVVVIENQLAIRITRFHFDLTKASSES
jgi:flagellar motor switch protein FliN